MATFSPEMINPQALDSSYLSTQFNMDDLAFQLQDPNALKTDMLSDFMDPFEGIDFRDERALSYSGTSSQSLSPQLPNRQMIPQLPELQGTNALFNAHLEPISPTGSDQSIHSTRKDSIDDDHRAEVCSSARCQVCGSSSNNLCREEGHRIALPSVHIVSARTRV